jgi:hypothetical protein
MVVLRGPPQFAAFAEIPAPGLVGQHHQGDDRDDGRLKDGSADHEEPHFVFCFFIHHRPMRRLDRSWVI